MEAKGHFIREKWYRLRLISLSTFLLCFANVALIFESTAYVVDGQHRYDQLILAFSEHYGVDPVLVKSVIKVESGFDPNAVSPKGASGLMQLLPPTAQRFGVSDIFDPDQNIRGGVRYLSFLSRKFNGNYLLVLAGYNAGENSVIQAGYRIPPFEETKTYIRRVMSFYHRLKAGVPKRGGGTAGAYLGYPDERSGALVRWRGRSHSRPGTADKDNWFGPQTQRSGGSVGGRVLSDR